MQERVDLISHGELVEVRLAGLRLHVIPAEDERVERVTVPVNVFPPATWTVVVLGVPTLAMTVLGLAAIAKLDDATTVSVMLVLAPRYVVPDNGVFSVSGVPST
jgi:hypothetical protein